MCASSAFRIEYNYRHRAGHELFRTYEDNVIRVAADAPYVARSSAAIVITMYAR